MKLFEPLITSLNARRARVEARTMFKLDRVGVRYGSTWALQSVSLSIAPANTRRAGSPPTRQDHVAARAEWPDRAHDGDSAASRDRVDDVVPAPFMLHDRQRNVALYLAARSPWRDACKHANDALARRLAALAQRTHAPSRGSAAATGGARVGHGLR
jgi:hypothetical protein